MKRNYKVAIIGLGYVGLPLAVEFSKKFETIGFDINSKRINELKNAIDITNEIPSHVLKSQILLNGKSNFKNRKGLILSNSIIDLKQFFGHSFFG